MKKKQWLLIASGILIFVLIFSLSSSDDTVNDLTSHSRKDNFSDDVVTTGELMAKNSVDINAPSDLRRYRIYNVKIVDLVPEGTEVDSNEFIGSLEKSAVNQKIDDVDLEIEKFQSQYTQQKLDTALNLRASREAIRNLEYNLEQKKLQLEQSEYEPPATIRQIKLELKKATRELEQKKENYIIEKHQAEAKMIEVGTNLKKQIKYKDGLINLQNQFIIMAPKSGMIVYHKEWGGSKRKVGSTIDPWNNVVATLPDLSVMLSKTYINEVDIRKVKVDQKVNISLDAFPKAKLEGIVTEVANVGEKRANSESKVFEVIVEVTRSDSVYRPGMTTSNAIVTFAREESIIAPLECVFSDGVAKYVFVKDGGSVTKQEVELGRENSEEVIIKAGIVEDIELLMVEPENSAELDLQTISKTS
jgi:HlyD family secretion protein